MFNLKFSGSPSIAIAVAAIVTIFSSTELWAEDLEVYDPCVLAGRCEITGKRPVRSPPQTLGASASRSSYSPSVGGGVSNKKKEVGGCTFY